MRPSAFIAMLESRHGPRTHVLHGAIADELFPRMYNSSMMPTPHRHTLCHM